MITRILKIATDVNQTPYISPGSEGAGLKTAAKPIIVANMNINACIKTTVILYN